MTFPTWKEADEARGPDSGLVICGGYHGDKPFYFLMPEDADDTSIRDVAFSIREGRDIGTAERRMIGLVETIRPEALEVDNADAS